MTREEKELLLNDLCARLPYGVKCYIPLKDATMTLTGKRLNYFCFHKDEWGLDYSHEYETVLYPLNSDSATIKPYLRPMSSMTEEEKKELYNISVKVEIGETFSDGYIKRIDWLNAHHFDYRGLIEKGLALEAPKGMYDNINA